MLFISGCKCINVCVHMHAYIHMCVHVCMGVWTFSSVYMRSYVCVCVCVRVCVNILQYPTPPSIDVGLAGYEVFTSYKEVKTAHHVKLTGHNRETFLNNKPFGQHNELF